MKNNYINLMFRNIYLKFLKCKGSLLQGDLIRGFHSSGSFLNEKGNNGMDNISRISENKEIINYSNINHIIEKEEIILNKSNFNKKYLGGFTSYNKVVILSNFIFTFDPNFEKISIDRKALLLSVKNFLNKLEDGLTYSVLFLATNNDKVNYTISKSSMIIHKNFSDIALTEILLSDINRYLNTYLSHRVSSEMNFNIIAQFKIWVSEEEFGKDKFMEIKRVIAEDGLKKLKILTNVNTIESDDEIIMNGLKNMKFYDFNLAFNHWFEKELFFSSLPLTDIRVENIAKEIKEESLKKCEQFCMSSKFKEEKCEDIFFKKNVNYNLPLNDEDVVKLYNEFIILLKNNKDVTYYLDDKYNDVNDNNKLKIMFRSINTGKGNTNFNGNDNNVMVNTWMDYSNDNIDNRFIREAIIYRDDIKNPLIRWIDFICLNDSMNMFNVIDKKDWVGTETETTKALCVPSELIETEGGLIKQGKDKNMLNIFYFNNFKVVERHIEDIKFTWEDNSLIKRNKKIEVIKTNKELLDVIQPLDSINIFKNFIQTFKVPTLEELPHEQGFDNKIGVIDLETYTIDIDENNYYKQSVYAGGWRVGEISKKYYIGDIGCLNSVKLIKKMFDDIFKDGFANYTFFAHNTGKFDSHFIVNSLLVKDNDFENYDLSLIVGDNNDIIELSIKRKKKEGRVLDNEKKNYGKIRLHDSYKIIPDSLNSIAKDLLNLKGKENFPHSFINKNTIHYKGEIPENKYFKNLNEVDYLKMNKKDIWSTKDNCLNYLQVDLDILYNAMITFAQTIWHEYGINLRQRKTISGLALLIYQSNYLNKSKCKIPLVTGGLERYFRSAYFGGITQIGSHHCEKAFVYDMNSQYPNAMLQYLPVGDTLRLMSVSKDNLKDCFGIVLADIKSPRMEDLRIPILPRRLGNGQMDVPHDTFWTGWYSSEELLNCINYGYMIFPKIAINIDKGLPFNDYVNELYEKKKKASEDNNKVLRKISKLLLNTLYGRMGMRNEFFKAKIVRKKDLNKITKLRNWNVMFEYENTDYVLIKYGNFIDSKLLDIIEMRKEEISEVKIHPVKKGNFSSIPIAVSITAKARISISQFKNIPGNPLIYSDTDSAVLPLPLSSEYVGDLIGQMSLVNAINEAFFIGPKLYCYVNNKNEVTIASAGLDPKLLNVDEFKKLFNGEDVNKVTERFIVRANMGRVDIDHEHKFTIKGIKKDSKIQKEINDTPKWLKDNSLYTIGLNKKNQEGYKHPFFKVRNDYMKNNIVNNKRSFSLSSTCLNKDNSKVSIIIDNSNTDLINSRYNGIYKVYDNIWLKNKFEIALLEILIDLYDNNEFTIFNLYFLIKPDLNNTIINWDKLNNHLSQYNTIFLNDNVIKPYKNVGFIGSTSVFVFLSLFDEDNLKNISRHLKKLLLKNIENINKNINVSLPLSQFLLAKIISGNNEIINYNKKIELESELILIINADYENMEKEYKLFYSTSDFKSK